MPLDNTSLSSQAMAGAYARRDMSHAQPRPPISNTGVTSGQASETPSSKGVFRDRADAALAAIRKVTPLAPRRKSRAVPLTPDAADFLGSFRWDWWQFTLPNPVTGKGRMDDMSPRERAESLESLMDFGISIGLRAKPVKGGANGYRAGTPFALKVSDKGGVLTVYSGHRTNMPGVSITGGHGACHGIAEQAKARFGQLLLARADVSVDMTFPGAYEQIRLMSELFARDRGIRTKESGTIEEGRTFYLLTDAAQLRIYQKDLERVASGELKIEDADPDLIRVEFVFRPQSRAKRAFSDMSPAQMIRAVHWTRLYAGTLGQLVGALPEGTVIPIQRLERDAEAELSEDARLAHMRFQWGGIMCAHAVRELEESGVDLMGVDLDEVISARAGDMFGRLLRGSDQLARSIERCILVPRMSAEDLTADAMRFAADYEAESSRAMSDAERMIEHVRKRSAPARYRQMREEAYRRNAARYAAEEAERMRARAWRRAGFSSPPVDQRRRAAA